MSAWVPSDAELDALARGLPAYDATTDRAEQNRTSVLAGAASTAQQRRAGVSRTVALIALPIAASAAIVFWVTRRSDEQRPDHAATVEARGPARYEVASEWPDRVVRIDDGTISVSLSSITGPDRFRVRAPDAELESTQAAFVVIVAHEHLNEVTVASGRVELRIDGAPPVFLLANQSWSRPITVQRGSLDLAKPSQAVDRQSPPKPESKQEIERPKPQTPTVSREESTTRRATVRVEPTPEIAAPKPDSSVAPRTTPAPGETEFREGMAALRSNDAARAMKAFAIACKTLQAAVAEDACFWLGASARRAGATTQARDALDEFLRRFSSSARAGEAAALLGWILTDLNDLDRAEQHFRRAANDRVPKVRESATRGLTAIEHKRVAGSAAPR